MGTKDACRWRQMPIDSEKPQPFEQFVVIAAFEELCDAEIVCTALRSAGIEPRILDDSGEELANGVGTLRVAVRAGDVPLALHLLPLSPSVGKENEPYTSHAPRELSSDEWAASAHRTAKFACIFPPLLVMTLYLLLHALHVARTSPPADPYGFRRRLRYAVLLGVLIPAGLIVLVIMLAAPTK